MSENIKSKEEVNPKPKSKSPTLTTPMAILISGILIASVIGYTNFKNVDINKQQANLVMQNPNETQQNEAQGLDNIIPIEDIDHVRGAQDPLITIFEYSDPECPFCKRFHDTMKTVITKHGDYVAWVYRHFPLESLHPEKAMNASLAFECAYDQGGDNKFWAFTDRYYELTPANNRVNHEEVFPLIVKELALEEDKFFNCLNSRKGLGRIERDIQNAVETGGKGTPWSIIVINDKDNTKVPIPGALSEEVISQLIEQVKKIQEQN